jgi:hypothetical protein
MAEVLKDCSGQLVPTMKEATVVASAEETADAAAAAP